MCVEGCGFWGECQRGCRCCMCVCAGVRVLLGVGVPHNTELRRQRGSTLVPYT